MEDRSGGGRLAELSAPVALAPPHDLDAEQSVVGQMLRNPRVHTAVVGTLLEPAHFYSDVLREIYGELVARHYADEPTDPLSVASTLGAKLGAKWECDGEEVRRRLGVLAAREFGGSPVDHAKLVKRKADYRALLLLTYDLQASVHGEEDAPDVLAGNASHAAMQIATDTLLTQEIVDFRTLGQNYIREQRKLMAARAAGIEIGVYFGMSFIDSFTRGLRGSELLILGGEPGAGKSAVVWVATTAFAERQAMKPPDQRIATLVLSLEMAEEPSSMRIAQHITKMEGGKLREGRTTEADLSQIISEWGRRQGLPLYFNFASNMRASQLRALVVEAIRRHNVGLVVIDHFRYVEMDGDYKSSLEQEEALAKFLKQDVATQLNVAVLLLAHTTKGLPEDGRPDLRHLRGGQLVSGHADYVGFVYRPYNYASQEEIDNQTVKRTDAELIWAKTRHGLEGTARFHFDPTIMEVH